jgi:hypothetical protein
MKTLPSTTTPIQKFVVFTTSKKKKLRKPNSAFKLPVDDSLD